jgi:type I restriction enzyme S subunit
MKSGHIKISRFNEGLTVFKPDYYLNRGKKAISDLLDRGVTNSCLADLTDKLYQGGIFKRVFVENEEYAHQYITASDMVKTHPLDTAKNISIKYTPWVDEMTLRDKQILVSCAGTVGNTALVNDSFSGCIGSQEIIRIETSKVPYGFLYAYISAPIVNEYIQSMIYGAVVPRISPGELGRLPVLLPEEPKQQHIHNLIVETSKLRVEANKLLKEAVEYFEEKIDKTKVHLGYQTGTISSKALNTFHKRLDGQYQLLWKDLESEKNDAFVYESLWSFAKTIFVGGRGKRLYTESGVPFLSSSDMMLFNPKRECKKVSKRTPGLNNMMVSKYDILISRSGTVGNIVLVGDDLAETAISEHALRLVIDSEKISPKYVFCFLKTKYGMKCMEASSFGSVIITLNEDLIGNIELPILDNEHQEKINNKVELYLQKMDEATLKENQAINLIENEIEQWQTS